MALLGNVFKSFLTSPSCNLVLRRHNWRKNLAKQEAKKQLVYEYVGENATRTSVIFAWGAATSGALGIASFLRPNLKLKSHHVLNRINRPCRVRFFDIHRLKPLDIACGYGFTLISVKLENKKMLLGTGINTDSQLSYHESPRGSGRVLDRLIEPGRIRLPLRKPDECNVVTMACGRAHTVVVVEDEGVFTFGNNAFGQCGRSIVDGEQYSKNQTINKMEDLPSDVIKQVVCGQDHTLFLTQSGQVYSCGLGADGQTGLGHYRNTAQPTLVQGDIAGEKIVSVGSRGDCTLAVSENGDVFGWGNSEYNQLALITEEAQVNLPRHLPLKNCGKVVKAVTGGSLCALLNDQGQVFVWGYGILGKGPKLEASSVPSQIPDTIFGRNELSPDIKVVDIMCGLTYLAAQTDQGDIYTWGRNNEGCLGLGESKNQFFPWRVAMPAQAVKFACGVDHMVTLCKSFT